MGEHYSNGELGYQDPTISEVYMATMFASALDANGPHRPPRPGFSPGTVYPEAFANPAVTGEAAAQQGQWLKIHSSVTGLPPGYSFSSIMKRRQLRADLVDPVGPDALTITAGTDFGSVEVGIAMPSRQRWEEPRRRRAPDELLPPHATMTLHTKGDVRTETIMHDLLPHFVHGRYHERDALVALSRLIAGADSIDLPNGAHALTTADMHWVMDFLVSFWGVKDDRILYPNTREYLAVHTDGALAWRDRQDWPPRDRDRTLPLRQPSRERPGEASAAPYGQETNPEVSDFWDRFSPRRVLAGLRRAINALRSKDF